MKKFVFFSLLFSIDVFSQSITNFNSVLRLSVITNPINNRLTTNFIVSSDAGPYLQAMLYWSVADFYRVYSNFDSALVLGDGAYASNFPPGTFSNHPATFYQLSSSTNLYKFDGITSPTNTNATTSTNYVLIHPAMSNIVTVAGNYDVDFHCTFFGGAANDIGLFAVHTNGVMVPGSEVMAGASDLLSIATFAGVILPANTLVEIYYRAAGVDTISAINPRMRIRQVH